MSSPCPDKPNYDIFTIDQEQEVKLKELRSVFIKQDMERSKTTKETIQAGFSGFKDDTRRFFSAVKRRIRFRKKEKDTEVKSIHIVPDDDGETWARRSASSAASRSSIESGLSSDSGTCVRNSNLKVIHDMDTDILGIS